jgi:hypothetical protein
MSDQRVSVVIDYQNIHLTAYDLFGRQLGATELHHTLIHPLLFAQRVVDRWTASRPEDGPLTLDSVYVFRGAPSQAHDAFMYGINQRQMSEWTRDRRVNVRYRTLQYRPGKPPREKGIDVLVALKTVELTQSGACDVVVLAAHDTDLEPALEQAHRSGTCMTATAGWVGGRVLQASGVRTRHVALSVDDCRAVIDRRNYAPRL